MGSVVGTLFGGGREAAAQRQEEAERQAMQAYQQAFQQARAGMLPWQKAGVGALQRYQAALAPMADPAAFYRRMISGWQMSPGAQFQLQQAEQAARRGAVAGVSPAGGAEQEALARYTQGLTSQDVQQYYQNLANI
jgi:hypothetical protein